MKTAKLPAFVLLFISTLLLIHCTPARQDYATTAKEIISQGKWSVDYYFAGQNKTSAYTNYQFTFNSNGGVNCTAGTTVSTGTWSMITDVDYNDVMIINMNTQEPVLLEFSQKWNVTDKSLSAIGMKDISNVELRLRRL